MNDMVSHTVRNELMFTQVTGRMRFTAPYVQSHQHSEPKLEKEQPDAYDERTWRNKMNTEERDGKTVVVIPAFGFSQCLVSGAKYGLGKIAGQGNRTWAKKFEPGIMLPSAPVLNLRPDEAQKLTISVDANGKRGSGTRVTRRFPIFLNATFSFEVWILDPILTQDVFRAAVTNSGMFVGLGTHAPRTGGSNGRFILDELTWVDNRRMVT